MRLARPAINSEFQKCIDKAGSQSNLARMMGCKPQTINDIARGKRKLSARMGSKLWKLYKDVKKERLVPDFEW